MEMKYARTAAEIESCWPVIHVLRPELREVEFVEQILRMMAEGYRLLYISLEGRPVSFAGFRNMEMLYSGPVIYIDDLSTMPEFRGMGFAGMLLDHIHNLAKIEGKSAVHLDSGYHRHEAHRFYLNRGYKLSSHHFIIPIYRIE